MALLFDRVNRIATVPIADGRSITVQSIYDQFRDFEDEPSSMDLPTMIEAEGKFGLAGGNQTIVSIALLDGWRLAFAAGAGPTEEIAQVIDGNITALTALDVVQFPIAATAFVAGFIAQATTGALISGSSATAQEIWDYAGPFAAGGIGDFIKKKILKTATFLGLRG